MTNEQQNVTAANQPMTSQNGLREGEGGEEKNKAEEEAQEPGKSMHSLLCHLRYFDGPYYFAGYSRY